MRNGKYNATKVVINKKKFDSKAEGQYYLFLLDQQKRGLIKIIELQPKVYLTNAKILYKPDFLIQEGHRCIYVDVKGMKTPVFAIKKRLWVYYGGGTLRIVKNGKIIEEVKTL